LDPRGLAAGWGCLDGHRHLVHALIGMLAFILRQMAQRLLG